MVERSHNRMRWERELPQVMLSRDHNGRGVMGLRATRLPITTKCPNATFVFQRQRARVFTRLGVFFYRDATNLRHICFVSKLRHDSRASKLSKVFLVVRSRAMPESPRKVMSVRPSGEK